MSASIELILTAQPRDLGSFKVRRALPQMQRRMVGPFVFFDHMGPVDFAVGNGMDVRPHPHIGLSTLTYLFEGEALHRDTLGSEQIIRPGDVNWMTAGRGIAHSERSPSEARARPQRLHGIQTWIALPKEHEEVSAAFEHHSGKDIPEFSRDGARVRVVAGDFENFRSPVGVFSRVTYLDLMMPAGASFAMEQGGQELALYCVSGVLEVEGRVLHPGDLGVFSRSDSLAFRAQENSRGLVVGGDALAEPRHIWWNFVSSSRERIELAKSEWTQQAYGRIRGETEFIPLPER